MLVPISTVNALTLEIRCTQIKRKTDKPTDYCNPLMHVR